MIGRPACSTPAGTAAGMRWAWASRSDAAQGQGVGTALMAALCDYADNWASCLRIELTVYTDNDIAQRLYRNFGFELEGTFRGYALRDGRWRCDVVLMRAAIAARCVAAQLPAS